MSDLRCIGTALEETTFVTNGTVFKEMPQLLVQVCIFCYRAADLPMAGLLKTAASNSLVSSRPAIVLKLIESRRLERAGSVGRCEWLRSILERELRR
jgi:hypothetical protein